MMKNPSQSHDDIVTLDSEERRIAELERFLTSDNARIQIYKAELDELKSKQRQKQFDELIGKCFESTNSFGEFSNRVPKQWSVYSKVVAAFPDHVLIIQIEERPGYDMTGYGSTKRQSIESLTALHLSHLMSQLGSEISEDKFQVQFNNALNRLLKANEGK